MSSADWQPEWLQDARCNIWAPRVWRGVDSRYASATSALVDTLAEMDVLEALLEGEPQPPTARRRRKHHLLLTPFRHVPRHGSRFRRAWHGGAWYGAHEISTVCAELAYWRRRFLLDSEGLAGQTVTTRHTLFAAAVHGEGINLMDAPWSALRPVWRHDSSYHETQRLADAVQAAGLGVIRYESARAEQGVCLVVFSADALAEPRGGLDRTRQQWVCTASRDHVLLQAQDGRAGRYEWHAGNGAG